MNTVSLGKGDKTFLGISGFVADWRVWTFPFELLSKKMRCVSFDHRGVGESPAPLDSITVESLVDDVFGVMDALDIDKCILGGESFGGTIAALAALEKPERFEGLVLVDTSGPNPVPLTEERIQFMQLMKMDFKKAMEMFIESIFPETNSEHYKRMGLSIVMRPGSEVAIHHMEIMSQGEDNVPVHNIKIPTLVVCGSLDGPNIIENSKYLVDAIPDAELKVVEGAGHVPVVTRPNEVVEAIEKRFKI
jgi:pimeloyl-ACP methyl ester carboxylesterase